MKNITIELGWPTTANTHWRRNGNRYFISPKGKKYREEVISQCKIYDGFYSATDRLSVLILAYPPDRRKRDLDNLFKSLMDSLQHAGVYHDDSQIDELSIKRMPFMDDKVVVKLSIIDIHE